MSQAVVQFRTKGSDHHDPEYRNREYPGYARYRVVDSRSRADSVFTYRVHNDGGERSDRDRHSKPEHYDRREECSPVALSNGWNCEQSKPKSDNQWTSDQRDSWTIAGDKSSGPAREKEDEQNERKHSSTGDCGGIALDLDQI